MDNKELPQEVVNAIKGFSIGKGYAEKGAQIAHSHYIKELQAKENELRQLGDKARDYYAQWMGEHSTANIYRERCGNYEVVITAKDTTIKEQAEKIEKLTGLLRLKILEIEGYHPAFTGDEQVKEGIWQSYRGQHGI